MNYGFPLNDRVYEIDADGFLLNLDDWDAEVGEFLAYLDDLVLSDAHWEIIDIVRDYYRRYGISPEINVLLAQMKKKLGPDKGKPIYLLSLFPNGAVQVSKIAGTPKPPGCI